MDCTKHVLIIGSGPNAVNASELETSFDAIVVINNAWRIRSDWTHLIFPYDFPEERWPQEIQSSQTVITEKEFVPIQNDYGGFIYAGATMAFTAGYWVLGAFKPSLFLSLDVICITQREERHIFTAKGRLIL